MKLKNEKLDAYGLGIDLALDATEGDLVAENGDLRLVGGIDCLLQNLKAAFDNGYSSWGAELMSGSGLAAGVEADDSFFEPTVRAKVREVFRRDGRVNLDTVEFDFEYNETDGTYRRTVVGFRAVSGEPGGLVLPPFERQESEE